MRSTRNAFFTISFLTLGSIFFAYQTILLPDGQVASVIQSEPVVETVPTDAVVPAVQSDITLESIFTDFGALTGSEISTTSTTTLTNDESTVIMEAISRPVNTEKTAGPLTVIDLLHVMSSEARNSEGLKAFILSSELSAYAKKRSEDMTENNYLSHTSLSGCSLKCHWIESGIETLTWGENLAEFTPYSEALSSVISDTLITRWLESSGHRQNLLSNTYTHYGIGVSIKNERLVVTVIFGNL